MAPEECKVLLVDDDEDSCVLVRRLLSRVLRVRYRLDWVGEYDAGLKDIRRQAHDVVLLDYRLGARNGLDLLAEAIAQGCLTPIIVLTGQDTGDVDTRALQAGAADFLRKEDLSSEGLDRAIRHALDRKAYIETIRLQKRALERSNEELQRFAYVASHDLQQPLRSVTSYLQLIEQRYADRLDGTAREFIGFAVDGAKRMKQLIDDLLELSRVQTRGRPFDFVETEALVDRILTDLKPQMEEVGARIVRGTLPRVLGDAAQLTHVFQNLIGNALKYRSDAAPAIRIDARREEDAWIFAVEDNGIGIDPQFFDRIFQVFQRLHTIEEYPGTGVGLAIAKKIVERHGGRIWVESQPGAGAAFFFSLPIHRSAEETGA